MTDTVDTGATTTETGTAATAATTTESTATVLTESKAAEGQAQTETTTEQAAETTTEAKTDEADAKADDKTDEAKGAPEAYEEFTMPEGVELDAELGTDLKAIAKEFNLPQDQAQKLADLGAKLVQKSQAAQADALKAARDTWASESKADKEFGGDKFEANMAVAKKAVDAYASSELKNLLNQTGLGNHPEMIRLFHKVGQTISEDRFDGGRSTQGAGQQTAAERLYGNTKT